MIVPSGLESRAGKPRTRCGTPCGSAGLSTRSTPLSQHCVRKRRDVRSSDVPAGRHGDDSRAVASVSFIQARSETGGDPCDMGAIRCITRSVRCMNVLVSAAQR